MLVTLQGKVIWSSANLSFLAASKAITGNKYWTEGAALPYMSHKESLNGLVRFLIHQREANLIAFVDHGYKTYVIKTAYLSVLVTELTDC